MKRILKYLFIFIIGLFLTQIFFYVILPTGAKVFCSLFGIN